MPGPGPGTQQAVTALHPTPPPNPTATWVGPADSLPFTDEAGQ